MEENTDRDVESGNEAGGEDALVGNVNKLTQHRKTISENRVIFNVVNFSKTKSLYRDGMSPVVKSTSRPKWGKKSLALVKLFSTVSRLPRPQLSLCVSPESGQDAFNTTSSI
uniref:AGBL carboxypeptidase 4 n=1 Tax=Xiphophorus couchianus TaxID=32473 RepID=A0A3B5LSZ3_9TELE